MNEKASDGVQRNSSQLPDLAAKREVAAKVWEDVHRPVIDPRAPVYIDEEQLETSAYYDPVCGYRRGGADGSYSFAVATGTKSDLPAKRAKAAALWKAYEDAHVDVNLDADADLYGDVDAVEDVPLNLPCHHALSIFHEFNRLEIHDKSKNSAALVIDFAFLNDSKGPG